jgi:hypothetical protein
MEMPDRILRHMFLLFENHYKYVLLKGGARDHRGLCKNPDWCEELGLKARKWGQRIPKKGYRTPLIHPSYTNVHPFGLSPTCCTATSCEEWGAKRYTLGVLWKLYLQKRVYEDTTPIIYILLT